MTWPAVLVAVGGLCLGAALALAAHAFFRG